MYHRVIPRDLFNEAKLLKCMGKFILAIENRMLPGWSYDYGGDPFVICQGDDGELYVRNIDVWYHGEAVYLTTPLNSRLPWPLLAECDDIDDGTPCCVFNDEGQLIIQQGKDHD